MFHRSITQFFLVIAFACGMAYGQTITGSISGVVTDPSGAVVPGAKVTATETSTNIVSTTTTDNSGIYSLRFLPIGSYKLMIAANGFNAQTAGPFSLEVGQNARENATLAVGSASTSVRVNGEVAPILNTENATLATTFDKQTISSIPLNGRNFSSITLFLPGSVDSQPNGLTGSNAIERNTLSNGQVSINGNRAQTNNYLLDGVEINETINNLIGYNPAPDALQQVQVISANADAEYGNVNGGDVIAITKSGTNNFHGSIYGFLEDYKLDANTWGNKHSNPIVPKNPFTQSIFGATLGGPLIKNRLFFFMDYEGARNHSGGLSQDSVPTPLMRTGDFSELLDPAIMCSSTGGVCSSPSKLIQLYDPSNNFAPYVDNKGVPILNSAAKYLLAHSSVYPLPNATPITDSPVQNNFIGPSSSFQRNDQGDIKISYTPTQNDTLSGRYSQGEASDGSTRPLAISFPSGSDYPDKLVAINYVHVFSPALVNEFRAGFTRIRWNQGDPIDTTGTFGLKGNSLLGIPGTQAYPGFSALNFSNGFTNIGNAAIGTNFIDNTFTYGDTVSLVHGRNQIKVGVEFVRYQQNNFYPGNDGALGQFSYNGNYTSNPAATAATNPNGYGTGGYSYADFLLDRADFAGVGGVTGRTGQRQWRDAYFFQDDFKFRPNLVLNLGVRYEYDQPIYEVNNKEANVNLQTGAVELAGVAGHSRALYHSTYNSVMPRIGFNYQPMDRVVIRGGYGIQNFLEGTGANLRLTYNPPFQPSFEESGVAPSAASPGVSFQVENGFTGGAANFSGTTYRAWASNLRPAFISEYSLTTQYQISNTASFQIGYVGESGQHLIQAVAANQLRTPCNLTGGPNGAACSAASPAPFQALVGQSGAVVETASEGMMNYNALQATYRQRATRGLTFTVNYTYGRGMTNTDGFFGVPGITGPSPYAENAYNNHAEYGPVGQDVRHNINGTAVYELPFGKGRTFGGTMGRPLDELAGGWKLAMTAVVYSGFPVTPQTSFNNANTNSRAARPNQYRKVHIVHRSVDHWFGTDPSVTQPCQNSTSYAADPNAGVCAFGDELQNTYGDAAVGALRGPGYQLYNFSAYKDFPLVKEYAIGFRVDAFNAFNITSYSNSSLNANIDSNNFGQITGVASPARQIQLSAHFTF